MVVRAEDGARDPDERRPRPQEPAVVPVPKPRGGTRWLTVLGSRDADRYQRLVAPWTPTVLAAQGTFAFGSTTSAEMLGAERATWRLAVLRCVDRCRVPSMVVADVRECFPSIRAAHLGAGLRRARVPSAAVSAIVTFVRGVERTGTEGLPVGPRPSGILASAVLALADHEVWREGATVVRWVDDVVIVADGDRRAARAFDAWVAGLRAIGLEPHEGKVWTARGKDAPLAADLGAGGSFVASADPSVPPLAPPPVP